MTARVLAFCAGTAAPLGDGKKRSAIAKRALAGPVAISRNGVAGDVQVDRVHHGYPAMAVHHFPQEHYAWLASCGVAEERLRAPGAIGENIATTGVLEDAVCIGDRFRFGTALLEVTQPRQPCATIERHFGLPGLVKAMVRARKSGWFYRVIEEGSAEAGDRLDLIEEGDREWTVRRAFGVVFGGEGGRDELEALARVPRVSDRLQRDIAKRLAAFR